MGTKTYFIKVYYRVSGLSLDGVIPVKCTEENLELVAKAIGAGYSSDACVVYLDEQDAWCQRVPPYRVMWDCM